VTRLLGLLVLVLCFAYGTVISAASANAPRGGAPYGACSSVATAVEPDGDPRNAPCPFAPADIDDDDGGDDEREAFTQPSHVVLRVCRTTRSLTTYSETIQSSLGHPRGIDDPPRY